LYTANTYVYTQTAKKTKKKTKTKKKKKKEEEERKRKEDDDFLGIASNGGTGCGNAIPVPAELLPGLPFEWIDD
jgi:hypothetical protein